MSKFTYDKNGYFNLSRDNLPKFTYDKNGYFNLSRDNLRQLDPKVFEAAARNIDDQSERLTCLAIRHLENRYGSPLEEAWIAAFGPDTGLDRYTHPFWNKSYSPARKQARMTSLAMMATLVRSAKASRGKKKASH